MRTTVLSKPSPLYFPNEENLKDDLLLLQEEKMTMAPHRHAFVVSSACPWARRCLQTML